MQYLLETALGQWPRKVRLGIVARCHWCPRLGWQTPTQAPQPFPLWRPSPGLWGCRGSAPPGQASVLHRGHLFFHRWQKYSQLQLPKVCTGKSCFHCLNQILAASAKRHNLVSRHVKMVKSTVMILFLCLLMIPQLNKIPCNSPIILIWLKSITSHSSLWIFSVRHYTNFVTLNNYSN